MPARGRVGLHRPDSARQPAVVVDSTCALLVRNADVPVYVAYGQAQLGVVGDDVLREHPQELAPLNDFTSLRSGA